MKMRAIRSYRSRRTAKRAKFVALMAQTEAGREWLYLDRVLRHIGRIKEPIRIKATGEGTLYWSGGSA